MNGKDLSKSVKSTHRNIHIMLSQLPQGVRDIIQEYASGHKLTMSLKPYHMNLATLTCHRKTTIHYGPMRYIVYHTTITIKRSPSCCYTITLTDILRKEVTIAICFNLKHIILDHVDITLDCDQMLSEARDFIQQCYNEMNDNTNDLQNQW